MEKKLTHIWAVEWSRQTEIKALTKEKYRVKSGASTSKLLGKESERLSCTLLG